MDPHARMLLQHVYQAADHLTESQSVGTFVGCMWANEFVDMLPALGISQATAPAITGNTFPFLAGRIAYTFGWQGPCVPTDTACSSSMVAAHVGRLSLESRECGSAVVGGVNALLSSTTMIKICALQALSPVGRCKTFDASADGYERGEGFVVMVLEEAEEETENERTVVARLASTAVNSAGRSSGLTAPSGPAQRDLVSTALATANAAPHAVEMVAVHGTGTTLGDPIEVGALCQVLNDRTSGTRVAVFSSVKSCFGHTEGAAGLTGALLAMGALNSRLLPGIIGLRNVNPYVASTLDQWKSSSDLNIPLLKQNTGFAANSNSSSSSLVGTGIFGDLFLSWQYFS